jgi:chromosome segregation ATPase
MPTFSSEAAQWMFWILTGIAGLTMLVSGVLLGRWMASLGAGRAIASRERELFTAQKGFRQLYEADIATLKARNTALEEQVAGLSAKVDEYRKKAAGYGGLFSANNRRADAMYALLLENEALEEALTSKNRKLADERDEHLRETMRASSYRRVLMSHILADDRVKRYVNDVLADDKRLPSPSDTNGDTRALPPGSA